MLSEDSTGEILPETSFLSLPREIRDDIYQLLLVSPETLTVLPTEPTKPLFPGFTPGLFRANRAIAAEAAALFYGCNTFNLEKPASTRMLENIGRVIDYIPIDCWDVLYSFLLAIGARNRACLHRLEIGISRPKPVSIDAQGSASSLDPTSVLRWLREVQARDRHTRTYPPTPREEVFTPFERAYGRPSADYVSPAIEAVFRLLGPEGGKLQLTLLIANLHIPQLNMFPDGSLEGWSGEIPSFIEILRKRFTCGPAGQPRVEVLWSGSLWKSGFALRSEALRKDGWEIVEARDCFGPVQLPGFEPPCYFTLRRNGVACVGTPGFLPTDYYYGQ